MQNEYIKLDYYFSTRHRNWLEIIKELENLDIILKTVRHIKENTGNVFKDFIVSDIFGYPNGKGKQKQGEKTT